ncbi:MAG: copper-binding protein [Deltaproteobacteria bacterium]|nr:copper-binding protein [Deltaproteobacteria bacterium]
MSIQRYASICMLSCVLVPLNVYGSAAHEKKSPAQRAESHHPDNWRFRIPKGDPIKGRSAFEKFECYYCHEVKGEDFPYPAESAPELSQMGPLHPPEYFAESILHPSAVVPQRYRDVDGKSPMSMDHIVRMTLQEFIDISSYLASLKPNLAAKNVNGEGTVIALTPGKGEIILDHKEIVGFMDAMTMGYKTASAQMVKGFKPGDKVRFTIDVDRRMIVDIKKIKP